MMGNFTTNWEYDQTFDHGKITYHLWKCQHKEGYTAYQITRQSEKFEPPNTTAHYTSFQAVKKVHPMIIERE